MPGRAPRFRPRIEEEYREAIEETNPFFLFFYLFVIDVSRDLPRVSKRSECFRQKLPPMLGPAPRLLVRELFLLCQSTMQVVRMPFSLAISVHRRRGGPVAEIAMFHQPARRATRSGVPAPVPAASEFDEPGIRQAPKVIDPHLPGLIATRGTAPSSLRSSIRSRCGMELSVR
jgi:hypothetical protein